LTVVQVYELLQLPHNPNFRGFVHARPSWSRLVKQNHSQHTGVMIGNVSNETLTISWMMIQDEFENLSIQSHFEQCIGDTTNPIHCINMQSLLLPPA
jgi:hypothetical protein